MLRRIMRRAMRHAHMLGCREPLVWRLVPRLVQQMGAAYPELLRAQPLSPRHCGSRRPTLNRRSNADFACWRRETTRIAPGEDLSGEIAFRLYDTYGFPLDLTEDVLRGQGRKVAVEGFDTAMARQREEARKSWIGSGEAATETIWFAFREELGATEFLGYETESAEGVVLAILRNGARLAEAAAGRRRANRQPDALLCSPAAKPAIAASSFRPAVPNWRSRHDKKSGGTYTFISPP